MRRRSIAVLAVATFLVAAAPPPSGKTLLKRANALHASGRYTDAIATFDKAAQRLPEIADWINVFAANSAARLGDTLQVARRLKHVNETIVSEWAWRIRSRAFEQAGARGRALQVARGATDIGTAALRAAAWYRVAELQRDAGNSEEQKTALRNALKAAPESDAALDAALELARMSDLSGQDRIAVARALMRNGESARGLAVLRDALADNGISNSEREQVHYDIARAQFNAGKYADAIAELVQLPRTNADAQFLLARAELRAGQDAVARTAFSATANAFPNTSVAARSWFVLADLAHDSGAFETADSLYRRAAAVKTTADESLLALMRTGGMAFARGNWASAAADFQRLRERSADYKPAAMYWLALTRLKTDNKNAADSLLLRVMKDAPLSYYGLRAADLLQTEPDIGALPKGPVTKASDQRRAERTAIRWKLLHDVEWDDAAAFELVRGRRQFDDKAGLYALAEALKAHNAAYLGLGIGRELIDKGEDWNRRLLAIMYPMPYKATIRTQARAHHLDPYFVAALIRQESRFNPEARSGVGAIGLMQVMPATGRQLRKSANVRKVTETRLMQPETNIKLGTRFLADLMSMYRGRVDAVLIAYNAGPSRADRWRKFPEFANEDLFVERIPFDETREYVKVVKTNAAIYRALYADRVAK